jgi:hypothetical protein
VEALDRYLLGEEPSKRRTVELVLAARSPLAAAAPFYRALEAVGERAADEALLALRLVLAGKGADDDRVRRLRAASATVRAARKGDHQAVGRVDEAGAAYAAELS